ncbi:conserved hypothetical protein [Ricinus communis]|uniref:Uncharacterized protein n=1 Tax=Ricinus communis TaxID=3988 RepID=B9SJR8_RICCO|nr:conserved hypothetical protein [Ricinus communis]
MFRTVGSKNGPSLSSKPKVVAGAATTDGGAAGSDTRGAAGGHGGTMGHNGAVDAENGGHAMPHCRDATFGQLAPP